MDDRRIDTRGRLGTRARKTLRALHRDLGFFVVGLTFVYALSGLAVNHVSDWDPNFHDYERAHALPGLPSEPSAAARAAADRLGIRDTPSEVYEAGPGRIDVVFESRTLHVDVAHGRVVEEGQRPRPILRLANWLHLNRGKKAWTYVADAYAIVLLFLATSGMTMMAGRQGIFGRGGIFLVLGVAIPVGYVVLSGGP